jgi:TRAP-type C4-dicarboxylate transport system substrate-binding protein
MLALPSLWAAPAWAQPAWTIGTEYPASAMPGEGIAHFAATVTAAADGALTATAQPDAPLGLRSAALLGAVAENRLQAACAFTGAMASIDPIFALSALPFLTASAADAARLLAAARPAYVGAVGARGATLLYATPWPPTGIWSRERLAGAASLRGLKVRTYDAAGTAVFQALGAAPQQISFADALVRIREGAIDAALSSGDGGAGARLWEWLPHFTSVDYAWPLSLAFCSTAALAALPPAAREAVRMAGAATEARQWRAIETRLAENTARMRAAGVRLADGDAALLGALREAAAPVVAGWAQRAGAAGAAVLAAYRG